MTTPDGTSVDHGRRPAGTPRRLVLALVFGIAALSMAGCGTATMDGADIGDSATAALTDAGIAAGAVDPADEPAGNRWSVEVDLGDATMVMELSRTSGRVVALELDENVDLSDDQLRALADHADNPADRRARSRRALVGAIAVLVAVGGTLALARRARLRDERAQSELAAGVD